MQRERVRPGHVTPGTGRVRLRNMNALLFIHSRWLVWLHILYCVCACFVYQVQYTRRFMEEFPEKYFIAESVPLPPRLPRVIVFFSPIFTWEQWKCTNSQKLSVWRAELSLAISHTTAVFSKAKQSKARVHSAQHMRRRVSHTVTSYHQIMSHIRRLHPSPSYQGSSIHYTG